MELLEFSKKLLKALEDNNIHKGLNLENNEKLYYLTEFMLKANEQMNLTAITDLDAIILKHYVDSLMVSQYIPEGATVIDVGCGAGFPCLPLAIFRKDLTITALDATAKRIRYIDDVARRLEINNIKPIAARAEELARLSEYRGKYDIATARAVAALPILSELCLPFVKIGGSFVAMKGAQGVQEASDARNAIRLCGGEIKSVDRLNLVSADSSEDRIIVSVEKISATPAKYPRHYSKISKQPL